MASRLFHIYDIRKMDIPAQQRESSLKYMTRSLACMPDGQGLFGAHPLSPLQVSHCLSWSGYATASVEGRIAVEYFDPSPAAQEKRYAFKCHRQTINDVDHVWPVNALAFHPTYVSTAFFKFPLISLNTLHRYNTFASAGSDGTVSIWDHKVKKRLRQYPKFPNPVSAIAFNCDGTKIAVGASYTWDEGEEGLKHVKTPWLGVRRLGDEVKVGVGSLLSSNCGTDFFSPMISRKGGLGTDFFSYVLFSHIFSSQVVMPHFTFRAKNEL